MGWEGGKVKVKFTKFPIYLHMYNLGKKGELIYRFVNYSVVIRGAYEMKKVGLVMTLETVELIRFVADWVG